MNALYLQTSKVLEASLTLFLGLVGDIELNKQVLRDFIIHSLSMKPGFVNRLVFFNYYQFSLHVCVSLSLHLPAPDLISLIIFLLRTITIRTRWQNSQIEKSFPVQQLMLNIKLWTVQWLDNKTWVRGDAYCWKYFLRVNVNILWWYHQIYALLKHSSK